MSNVKKIVRYANSKEEVTLNKAELYLANKLQAQLDDQVKNGVFENAMGGYSNSSGFEIDITTLTQIAKSVTDQKFFEVAPADYMPVIVGEGAYASEILKYTSFATGGSFEQGFLNTGSDSTRLASADAEVQGIKVRIQNWAKEINWNLFDLNMAARAGNWDIVTQKERARKKNWDLGIQKVAFLGSSDVVGIDGLLTQSDVTSDTTTITGLISGMTAAQFNTLTASLYEAYRANSNRTAVPTHFIIPEKDYNGLATATDEAFPLKSRLTRLKEMFVEMTQNPDFKILPLAYGNEEENEGTDVGGKNRYVMLNYDEDSLSMNIPVDYTNTMANTIDGFNFKNVAYGQFTGLRAYRPLEVLYFDWETV